MLAKQRLGIEKQMYVWKLQRKTNSGFPKSQHWW